jgi:proteasome lid subunit RPN8/RPN11
VLTLTRAALDAALAHAAAGYPHEVCGLLLGRDRGAVGPGGRWTATAARPATNLEPTRAHDRYLLDPKDRLAAEAEARAAGLAVVGFYHSHPDHDAYFSATDLERSEERQWGEPWVPSTYAYLVISVRDGRPAAWRAFVVEEGQAREVPVSVEPGAPG